MIKSVGIHKLLSILNKTSAGFSLVFNTYLVFLILTKSPKELSAYKYLLIFTSIFEIFYSLLEAYLVPIHYSFNTTDLVMISSFDKPFSRSTLLIWNSIYWGFFGSTLSIYAIHFIYRYLTVTKNILLQSFNTWRLILWLAAPFLIGVAWCLIGFHLCGPEVETNELARSHVLKAFERPIEDYVYLGGSMYIIAKNGEIIPDFKLLSAMSLMSSTVMTSFAIILYCGLKCYSEIKNMMNSTSTVSSKSRSLQSQLFHALVIQIIIPVVLLDIPITIFFGLTLLNNGIEGYSGYLSFFISLYPAIDPLPNFFVIIPYRKALIGLFQRKAKSGLEVAVPPNSLNPVRI